MPLCYGCKRHWDKAGDLVAHIRSKCRFLSNDGRFKCGEEGCFREYFCGNSLYKHLVREHCKKQNEISTVSEHSCPSETISLNTSSENAESSSLIESSTVRDNQKGAFESLTVLISSLYANPLIPRNSIQSIITDIECSFRHLNQSISSKLIDTLSNRYDTTISSALEPFKDIKSEHKCMKFFENKGSLISPIQISVGSRTEFRRDQMHSMPCTIQVIPLQKVLKCFLSLNGLLGESLVYMNRLKEFDEPVENLIQGSVWKAILDQNEFATNELHLPIIVYYDEMELGNPLGSHASIHKLGATYLSLPFLPKKYFSLLNTILMVSLCHSSDRVNLGNKMIFSPVIEMLNNLSQNGITVSTETFKGVVKFHVCCMTGDNLGLNGILGFVESFSANYCCRFCSANKAEIQTLLEEDLSLLRSSDSYAQDLANNDPKQSGIKEKSIWLDLKGFNIFQHVAVDFLHDFLEGVCRYTLSVVVMRLVDSKLVTLDTLISKIDSFDYGPDNSSKPTNAILKEGSSIRIKTSAAEMLTLVRYLPLIAGSYVPEDNDFWSLLLSLRELLDKLMSPRIYKSTVDQCRGLIRDFLLEYKTVAKKPLTPKFHFLIHYPRIMGLFGPLTQLWTMRFEAKHRVSKIAARTSSSRVNICKTVAIRNQLTLNHIFLKENPFRDLEHGIKTKLSKSTIQEMQTNFPSLQMVPSQMFSVKWIKKYGFRVDVKSSILTTDMCLETGYPVFGRVVKIYLVNTEQIILQCTKVPCISYNDHYFAYEVDYLCNNMFYVNYEELHTPIPNTFTIMSDFKGFVTVRSVNE
ncbi:hypothetical protein WDU94_000542 [Cyamophila willieti]